MLDISIHLDTKEIKDAILQLKKYKSDLPVKCALIVSELANVGIRCAQTHVPDEYGSLITFSKDVQMYSTSAQGEMKGVGQIIIRQWVNRDGVQEAEVNPLLMAEFGSGPRAVDATGMPNATTALRLGMGRGTFPDQVWAYEDQWIWTDLEGNEHTSSGEEPTLPMFNAFMEMEQEIYSVVKKVFA